MAEDNEIVFSVFHLGIQGIHGLWNLSKWTLTCRVNIRSVYVDIALITLHCQY